MSKLTSIIKNRKKEPISYLPNGEQDIAYRGPLSYKGLRILAYFLMFAAQIAVLYPILAKGYFNQTVEPDNPWLLIIIQIANSVYSPLLFIAAFTRCVGDNTNLRSNIKFYGLAMIGIWLGFNIINIRYAANMIWALRNQEPYIGKINTFLDAMNEGSNITAGFYNKFFSVNIFVDVFWFSLLYLFLVGVPKKGFEGKKIILFRLLSIFPSLFIIFSILFKMFDSILGVSMPIYYLPLIGSGSPMMYIFYLAIVLYLLTTKSRNMKKNYSLSEFESYRKSKKHSLNFSMFAAFIMIGIAFLDLIAFITLIRIYQLPTYSFDIGFGYSLGLLFGAPIMMFFSYNKKAPATKIDLIARIFFILLIAFLYFDGTYMYICNILQNPPVV